MDLNIRSSGVLTHLTSLPGIHGIGDLGPAAFWFADWLAAAKQSWWQMLPIGPLGYTPSPYSASSAFAGNPLFISLELLTQSGLLMAGDTDVLRGLPAERVTYKEVRNLRGKILRKAFAGFHARPDALAQMRFEEFCSRQKYWLDDYALYAALKDSYRGLPWYRWSPGIRDRHPQVIAQVRRELATEIKYHRFLQFEFETQWTDLRTHCHGRGIGLMGDVPIFVEHDSADVWAHPEIFQLDDCGRLTAVAGVPPDYFSATGQRWGNPIYRWDILRDQEYGWWLDRLRHTFERFDAARLDHFIGFHNCWAIPPQSRTAVRGQWVDGPGADFFHKVRAALGKLPFVAEDLGLVTNEVVALRDAFRLPGLKVLQFAFGYDPTDPNDHPLRYPERSVVYTGTHDNDTTVGWFRAGGKDSTLTNEAVATEHRRALSYLGTDGHEIHWDMIELALKSPAILAILPLQDLMGLGSEARMNRPGTNKGNWEWRFKQTDLDDAIRQRLAELTESNGRVNNL